jgi:hypothetical protein
MLLRVLMEARFTGSGFGFSLALDYLHPWAPPPALSMPPLPSSLELSDVQIPLLCTFFSSFQLAVEWNILRPFRVFSDFKEPLTFFCEP